MTTPDPVQLGREIVQRCLAKGFALAGVCRAKPSDRAGDFRAWLANGEHGEMAFMGEYLAERLDPGKLLPGARSVIMVADVYAMPGGADAAATGPPPGEPSASRSSAPADTASPDALLCPASPAQGLVDPPPVRGRIAKYARGRDYHAVIKKRLHALADALRPEHPGALFRSFVDTAPVLEREHALRAGLGWVGKHTLLINPALGSFFVLGGIITTLDLRPEPGFLPEPDRCGTCTRCIDACPTGAITPYHVNATRCISYLTIEHAGPIEPGLAARMGDWLFGCDICQDVCPYNQVRDTEAPRTVLPAYTPRTASLDARAVAQWSASERSAALTTSPMKRATLEMFRRNARIVIENSGERDHDA